MARILIAEDDSDLQLLLTMLLERAGHQVVAVSDGEAALEVLTVGGFDLALLDNLMPKMTGVQVLNAMADWDPVRKPLTVVVSAVRKSETSYYENGADAFISKPFSGFDLVAKVADVLATSGV